MTAFSIAPTIDAIAEDLRRIRCLIEDAEEILAGIVDEWDGVELQEKLLHVSRAGAWLRRYREHREKRR